MESPDVAWCLLLFASIDLGRLRLFPFPDPLLFDAEPLFLPDVSARRRRGDGQPGGEGSGGC